MEREKVEKDRNELQSRTIHLEASVATLTERLQQVTLSGDKAWSLLQGSTPPEPTALAGDTATPDLFEGRS